MSFESRQLSRRQILGTLAGGVSLAFLSACDFATSDERVSPTPQIFRPPAVVPATSAVATRIPTESVIKPFPGVIHYPPVVEAYATVAATPTVERVVEFPMSLFSEAIRSNNLVPRVIQKQMWASDKMLLGADYLKRYRMALHNQREVKSPTLSEIGIVSSNNLPIALPSDGTVTTILDRYQEDLDKKNIVYWGGSMQNVPYLIGTINKLDYDEISGWRFRGEFHANFDFPFGDPASEDGGVTYQNYTDLEIALKNLHEYAHYLQDAAILSIVSSRYPQLARDKNAKAVIERLVESERKRITDHVKSGVESVSAEARQRIALNEAQANLVSQLALNRLIVMNGSKRMPGTKDDPYPTNFGSLYRVFENRVIRERNPFDPAWLSLHADWNK